MCAVGRPSGLWSARKNADFISVVFILPPSVLHLTFISNSAEVKESIIRCTVDFTVSVFSDDLRTCELAGVVPEWRPYNPHRFRSSPRRRWQINSVSVAEQPTCSQKRFRHSEIRVRRSISPALGADRRWSDRGRQKMPADALRLLPTKILLASRTVFLACRNSCPVGGHPSGLALSSSFTLFWCCDRPTAAS